MSERDSIQLLKLENNQEGIDYVINFPNNEILTSLTNYALRSAINSLQTSTAFVPLVVRVLDNDEMSLHKYNSSSNAGAEQAFKDIKSLPDDVKAYALVLTIMLPPETQKHNAILFKSGNAVKKRFINLPKNISPKPF